MMVLTRGCIATDCTSPQVRTMGTIEALGSGLRAVEIRNFWWLVTMATIETPVKNGCQFWFALLTTRIVLNDFQCLAVWQGHAWIHFLMCVCFFNSSFPPHPTFPSLPHLSQLQAGMGLRRQVEPEGWVPSETSRAGICSSARPSR